MNKKSKIYLIALIWSAVLLQLFINASVNREKKMVQQVMSESVSGISESSVRAYAFYGRQELSPSKKEQMVKKFAENLGITSGYEINHRQDNDNETTELVKLGAQGDTKIKLISVAVANEYGQQEYENYVLIDISLKGAATASVYEYKDILVNMYEELGMGANTNLYVCSQIKGKLTQQEMESEISSFFNEMDAKKVKEIELDEGMCVYAYSTGINEFVYQDGEKVNVNIAFTYDAENDVTLIHRAIPFIDKSF